MRIRDLHRWDVTYSEAVAIQRDLCGKLVLRSRADRAAPGLIAGADVSYGRGSDLFFAAVVLLTYPELETVEERHAVEKAPFPYIPGLLSFREGPVLLKAFAGLERRPDLAQAEQQLIGLGATEVVVQWMLPREPDAAVHLDRFFRRRHGGS